MTPSLDLIIPAYNEGHRIGKTLEDYLSFFDDNVHITVAMNACTDSTESVIEQWQEKYPNRLSVISTPDAIGKGGAVMMGWKQATRDLVGFVDADDSTTAAEFAKLLTELSTADGAIASRFLPAAAVYQRQSPLRTVMSKAFIGIVHLLYHLPFQDTQCGAKVFKRSVINAVIPELQETGFIFDVELLWKIQRHGHTINEVAIHWVDQPGSASLGTHGQFIKQAVTMFGDLISLRWKK